MKAVADQRDLMAEQSLAGSRAIAQWETKLLDNLGFFYGIPLNICLFWLDYLLYLQEEKVKEILSFGEWGEDKTVLYLCYLCKKKELGSGLYYQQDLSIDIADVVFDLNRSIDLCFVSWSGGCFGVICLFSGCLFQCVCCLRKQIQANV